MHDEDKEYLEHDESAPGKDHAQTTDGTDKLDFSEMDLSHLSDSDLEDLLSGTRPVEGIVVENHTEKSTNSSVKQHQHGDKGGENKGNAGEGTEDSVENNGTERHDHEINRTMHFEDELEEETVTSTRGQQLSSETSSERDITRWLKDGLSDKDFLTMLALYNSLDSSETEHGEQEHRELPVDGENEINSSYEAVRTSGALRNMTDVNQHDNWLETAQVNTPFTLNGQSNETRPASEIYSTTESHTESGNNDFPVSVADVTEPDTGQQVLVVNTGNENISGSNEQPSTATSSIQTSSSSTNEMQSDESRTITSTDQTNNGTVSPGSTVSNKYDLRRR